MNRWIPQVWSTSLKRFWLSWIGLLVGLEVLFASARISELMRLALQVGSAGLLMRYIALQLIVLFPIAAAIAALVSAMSLSRELTATHQLTAWRALGYSFRAWLIPLLFSGALLSCLSWTALVEMVPRAYHSAKGLTNETIRKEPLTQLLGSLPKESGAFVTYAEGSDRKHAKDLWIVADSGERAQLVHIEGLSALKQTIDAAAFDLISFAPSTSGPSHLIHEQTSRLVAPKTWLTDSFGTPRPEHSLSSAPLASLMRNPGGLAELIRRTAWALAPFTCLVLGVALGILRGLPRSRHSWMQLTIALATALFLTALFSIRKLALQPTHLCLLATSIHGLTLSSALFVLKRYSRGRL